MYEVYFGMFIITFVWITIELGFSLKSGKTKTDNNFRVTAMALSEKHGKSYAVAVIMFVILVLSSLWFITIPIIVFNMFFRKRK